MTLRRELGLPIAKLSFQGEIKRMGTRGGGVPSSTFFLVRVRLKVQDKKNAGP